MEAVVIYIDFETKSPVDIRACGAWVYSEHPETDVHCMAYAIDDGPVEIWHPSEYMTATEVKMRNDIFLKIKLGEPVEAHNALFERAIWENIMVPRYGWPAIKPEQWRCSAAKAAARALPRALGQVGSVLGLKQQKDALGSRVMMKLCRPRLDGSYWTPEKSPEDFKVLYAYCKQDVEVERELNKQVRDLHPDELKVWQLDQTINTRGIMLDIEAVEACLKMVNAYEKKLLKEVNQITKGKLENVSQRNKALEWLRVQGLMLDDLTKKTVSKTLENGDGLPPEVLRLLEIRQELGRTSTAKLAAMQKARCRDGRIRDTLMYHGAGTGRWSGKLVQLHNMPRGNVQDTDRCIAFIKDGDPQLVEIFFGDVMAAISSCLRGMLVSAPGKDLIVADYAAIEARVLFWLAGETKGMQMFRDGVDLYIDMAKTIYGRENVGKPERQLGKQAVLGCIAENVLVYSDSGTKYIQDITEEDRVWNGEKFVRHHGLMFSGVKKVIDIPYLNIELTLDHLVLTPQGWLTAEEIVLSKDMRLLESVKLSDSGKLQDTNLKKVQNVMSLSAVSANLIRASESTNSGWLKDFLVSDVLNLEKDKEAETPIEILISYLILDLERGGGRAGGILKSVAQTQVTRTSNGMVLEAYRYPLAHAENSWNTLLQLMASTSGTLHSIELIIPGDTKEVISEWLHRNRITETKDRRCYDLLAVEDGERFQAGKALVHNCGYQMGKDKFLATCESYGIQIEPDMAERAVTAYREKYKTVQRLWWDQEAAAVKAAKTGQPVNCGKVTWFMHEKTLYCKLPSKRCLAYNFPSVKVVETPWGQEKEQLSYYAMNSMTKKWEQEPTYGGKIVENITQAVARDIMASAMLRVEAAGYPVVLTVHDELVAEVPEGFGSVEEFENLMAEVPEWGKGCPIKAEGWRGKRYKK